MLMDGLMLRLKTSLKRQFDHSLREVTLRVTIQFLFIFSNSIIRFRFLQAHFAYQGECVR